jgi:hypothetical protein
MDWLIYLCIALVAMKFGWWLHEAFIIYVIHEHPERLELAVKLAKKAKELELKPSDTVPETPDVLYLNVEKEPNGQLYAYNMSTFVAQGSTIEEIHERAKLRFPRKWIVATLVDAVSPN